MNTQFLNQHRLRRGDYASDDSFGFTGAFSFPVPNEARRVFCIASDMEGWQHVSVSFGSASLKTPSWEVMSFVRDAFFAPEDWVVQFHPPHSQYVNNHPGCLHLWRSLDSPQPTPPKVMV